ncbi:MAG: DUF1800 domain-containing protein [Rhodobacteraceae bacterium]|nr:DUF1800 domain-containing protein [Paracoccaceae bacterium]
MPDIATLSAIRFGTGLTPDGVGPVGAEALLASLCGTDQLMARFPEETFHVRAAKARDFQLARRARRNGGEEAEAAFREVRRAMQTDMVRQLGKTIARGVADPGGMRERLVWFWADHFTTAGTRGPMRGSITAYIEEAIRPHVTGRFGNMLEVAVLHPVMLLYLDQDHSVGPNSRFGLRQGRGLNENLAREVLELHTLGTGYTQHDVTEFAELLTGLSTTREGEFAFRAARAEPGPETVLGKSYGTWRPARLDSIQKALRDLALRPETARHLSLKLARHFLTDTPPEEVLVKMETAYLESGGDLLQTYGAMLAHPASWQPDLLKAKSPLLFVTSALKALGVPPEAVAVADPRDLRRYVFRPMIVMGQHWQGAPGPDGFPDSLEGWIRPQTLAARIGWAMLAPDQLGLDLPDPRVFVRHALADAASPEVIWAAARAETRTEGIGLVLASSEFQRR